MKSVLFFSLAILGLQASQLSSFQIDEYSLSAVTKNWWKCTKCGNSITPCTANSCPKCGNKKPSGSE